MGLCGRCFTLVWMSIIILQSPCALSKRHLPHIKECVIQFVSNTTIEDIRSYESDRGTIWATLLPYVKLAYLNFPPLSPRDSGTPSHSISLNDLCLTVIILFLHSKVTTPMYHTLLVQEGLLDFMVTLPWYVPPSCRSAALAMVADLRASLPSVGVPKLMNLAKAQLAKDRLGLELVLELPVGAIASLFFRVEA